MNEIKNISIDRRGFLGSAAAGALVLSVGFPQIVRRALAEEEAENVLNAFVVIEPNGQVIMHSPFVEMGQGVHTAIPMIIAEELDVGLDQIILKEAPISPVYRMHWGGRARFTGSSLTIKSSFLPLRRAGASARVMLINAAAKRWGTSVDRLYTSQGRVIDPDNARSISFGDLAAEAAKVPAPQDVKLKDESKFTLIGKPADRLDVIEKSNGSAIFGIDVSFPDMLVATVRQSPVFGGTVRSVNKDSVLQMPGVVGVEIIPNGTFVLGNYIFTKPNNELVDPLGTVAVVANKFWHAKKALDNLEIDYDDGQSLNFSVQEYTSLLKERAFEKGIPVQEKGDVDSSLASAPHRLEAVYDVPNLAHMVMEPMNCTTLFKNGKCKVWTGSQNAEWVAIIASKILNLSIDDVEVVTPYLGGGFGRRSNVDYVVQSVFLAKRFPGRPIKLMWTREEDTRHDFYRPRVVARFQAGFDEHNMPVAFRQVNVGDGASSQHNLIGKSAVDASVMDSTDKQAYFFPNKSVEYIYEECPVPLGFWRSVGGSHNGYFIESFIDEMANEAKVDPVLFRRRLLGRAPRFEKVLDRVSRMAGWRAEPWKAEDSRMHAMGVALYKDHGTIVGQVAEVSLDDDRRPVVHRVWCAVDCGVLINPAIATMQVESAIAYGLSAALMEEVDVKDGRINNSNF